MNSSSFELGTRQTALELISTLAEANTKQVRDQQETLKNNFLPALFQMMTQVEDEDDLAAWADKPEEEILGKNDAASIAAEALERLSDILGEKTILACSSALIFQGAQRQDSWQHRAASFMFLGMISESCGKKLKKDFDDSIKLIAIGLQDAHPRVRF